MGIKKDSPVGRINAFCQEFDAMLPSWIHDMNLTYGRCPNKLIDLKASFYEWLEAKKPGLGADFLSVYKNPRRWQRAMKALLRKRHPLSRLMNEQYYIYLNYVVTPKTPLGEEVRWGICDKCMRPTLLAPLAASQPTTEEIKAAFRALEAETAKKS